jgi:hypothetical protein
MIEFHVSHVGYDRNGVIQNGNLILQTMILLWMLNMLKFNKFVSRLR